MAFTDDDKLFADDEMPSRERLLAAYRGEPVDRVPYWAKVANPTWRTSQPDEVRAWSDRELLDFIHADGIFDCPGATRLVRPHVEVDTTVRNGRREIVTHTPDGDLTQTWTLDAFTNTWHPTEFPVKTREDIGRFRWLYEDVRCELDPKAREKAEACRRQIGQRGLTKIGWGTTPLMHLVEHVMSPMNVHFFLADCPEACDELIATMHAANLHLIEHVARHTPADLVVSVENTSTTLISPAQFERYCFVHLCDVGRAIESGGKMHELHMCGMTRALLPVIDRIPAASIEAFTAPTLGNTRLVHGRTHAPSKTLVGGTNVNTWLQPFEDICAYIQGELSACPDDRRIVLTTAGVAPPACSAETFRRVGEWMATVASRC